MARNEDVYLQSSGGKWVRYDAVGHMVKGEGYRYSAWYYFDNRTGALDTRRSSVIPSEYVGAAAGAFGDKNQVGLVPFRSPSWRQYRRRSRRGEHVSMYVS